MRSIFWMAFWVVSPGSVDLLPGQGKVFTVTLTNTGTDPVTLNLDPEDVAARVTDRTRAIMPVHLFGRVMPLQGLAKLGIPIIEDAAQAYGAEGVGGEGQESNFFSDNTPCSNLIEEEKGGRGRSL